MKSFMKVWLGISLMAIGFGIVLVIIAFATSGFHRAEATTSLHESYSGVTNIDMDINFKEVDIVRGEQFSISAKNLIENEIKSYVEDGTWFIRENNEDKVHLFGISFPVNQILDWTDPDANKITITIPDDFTATDIRMNIDAGSLEAESLKAENCDLNVDSGELKVEDLKVSNQSKYHVGTGSLTINSIQAKDIDLTCNVGNINISGTIIGNNKIQNDVGNVDLKLNGKEEDYSYVISCDVGDVSIGDEDYHNISNKVINKNSTDNQINLDCSVGKINIKFN